MRVRRLDRRGRSGYRGLPNQLADRGSPADQESESMHHDCASGDTTPAVLPRPILSSAGHADVESSSSSISTPCASGDTTPDDADPSTPTSETRTLSMDGLAFASGLRRPCIQLVNGALHPSDVCARKITSIFKERMDDSGYCWKNVSKKTKDFYWNKFQKHFTWDEPISSVIKMAWQRKAAERYRALMCSLRKKKDKTIHVSDSTWKIWNKAWNSPEFKARSLKFTANRLTEIGGPGSGISRHTGGSISHTCHAERLRSKLGRDPLPYELFEVTHTRKGTSKLVDARAETIKDRYLELVMQSSQTKKGDSEVPIVNKAALYYQAVGGEKKNRVYGVGSQAFVLYPQSSQTLSASTSSETLKTEIRQLRQTVNQLQESNKELQRSVLQMRKEQRQYQQSLLQMMEEQGQYQRSLCQMREEQGQYHEDIMCQMQEMMMQLEARFLQRSQSTTQDSIY